MTEDQKSEALELAKAMGGGPVTAAKGDTEYVVQMRDTSGYWADIATVSVPHRTPRRIVFRKALDEWGMIPKAGSEPLRLRALDAASAAEQFVEARQPDPEWVI